MAWDSRYFEIARDFEDNVIPVVKDLYEQDGVIDKVARREAWNNHTDFLCKEGMITLTEYDNWLHPSCCEYDCEYDARL